jgi:hypothetical protein
MKDVVRGHVALKIEAIQELEPTLELPDLGAEGWNVQLFRSIDSSEGEEQGTRGGGGDGRGSSCSRNRRGVGSGSSGSGGSSSRSVLLLVHDTACTQLTWKLRWAACKQSWVSCSALRRCPCHSDCTAVQSLWCSRHVCSWLLLVLLVLVLVLVLVVLLLSCCRLC